MTTKNILTNPLLNMQSKLVIALVIPMGVLTKMM